MTLLQRYATVVTRLRSACDAAGRDASEVRLVAVSKGHPTHAIRALYDQGHRDFGEARTRAWREKADDLPDDIRWHFIGHLQSKKVRELDARVHLLHTLDRTKLVAELVKRDLRVPVLLQCNVSGESTKAGVSAAEAPALLDAALAGGFDVRGLMTMAPLEGGRSAARATFDALATLRAALSDRSSRALPELSMGMSGDLQEAVHAGATLVRVGTAIFGPRELA